MADEKEQEKDYEVTLLNTRTVSKKSEEDPFLQPGEKLHLSKRYLSNTHRHLKKVFTGVGAESKQIEEEFLTGYSYLDCVLPPFSLDYLAKLYDKSPAHRAAVDAKVDNIMGLGFDFSETEYARIEREKAAQSKVKSKLSNFEMSLREEKMKLMEVIKDFNTEDTFNEILNKIGTDLFSTGNAYLEVGYTANNQIGYIGHLPCKDVRVRRQRDGFCQIIGHRVVFFRNHGDFSTVDPTNQDDNPNQVIHFKTYSPTNRYYGVPEILSAQNEVAGNEFAARYNLDYFENKAVPRYAIVYKSDKILSNTSRNKILEFLEAGTRGQNHRSIFIPLDSTGDIKFEAIENKIQDSSFDNYTTKNDDRIFMVHRTPQTKTGFYKQGLTVAASVDGDKTFKETVCRPLQLIINEKINKVFRFMSENFEFKLNEFTLTDEEKQSQNDERDLRMGVKVPNEIRNKRGLGPRPDGEGDTPWQANPQQAADAKAQATQSRERDVERANNQSDSEGNSRNPKGSGRKTP